VSSSVLIGSRIGFHYWKGVDLERLKAANLLRRPTATATRLSPVPDASDDINEKLKLIRQGKHQLLNPIKEYPQAYKRDDGTNSADVK